LVALSTPVFEQVEKFRVGQIHGRPHSQKSVWATVPAPMHAARDYKINVLTGTTFLPAWCYASTGISHHHVSVRHTLL